VERSPSLGAAKGSCMSGEGIGNDVQSLSGYAGRAELVGLELRNDDDGVESSEGEALELLVHAVLPTATGKTVYGGYYGHSRLAARMSTHDIGPVTVCMHYVYAARAAERPDERALVEVAAA
jgi:hypothetical protein